MAVRSSRIAFLVTVVVLATAGPAAAVPTENPNSVPWTQIDSVSPMLDAESRVAGNTTHLSFRREGTFVAWTAEAPGGPPTHWGDIGWSVNATQVFDRATGLPAQWTARSVGTQTFSDGVVCDWSNSTRVEFDWTEFPPLVWEGNTVTHCDDGSTIHGRGFGPLPPTLPGGSDQITSGVRLWPGSAAED